METFTDRIIIKNGVLLDKKDLIQLEELLKSGTLILITESRCRITVFLKSQLII